MSNPLCPECESEMVVRINKETHEEFYGCSDFPRCKGTRPILGMHDTKDELPSDRYRRADRWRWRNG